MVADGRPADAGGAGRTDARRHRALPRREPAGGRAHRPRPLPFRQSAGAVSHSRRCRLDRDLVSVAARNPQARAHRLLCQRRSGRRDAVFRARDQGRPALADRAWRQHSAVGVSQAGFRYPDCVAVRRIRQASRHAGQHRRAGAAGRRRQLAGAATGLRPDHADHFGLARCSIWRACASSGCSDWARPPASAC